MSAPPHPPPGPPTGPRTPMTTSGRHPALKVQVAQRSAPLQGPGGKGAAAELAGDVGFRVQSFLREQWQDFRSSDRYFKGKALIVTLWLGVSLASLFIAFGSSGVDQPESNDLGAYVRKTKASLGWSLLVHNTTDDAWTGCQLSLNGGYTHVKPMIAPGEKSVIGVSQFQKDGQPPPMDEEPRTLRIQCKEGDTQPVIAQ